MTSLLCGALHVLTRVFTRSFLVGGIVIVTIAALLFAPTIAHADPVTSPQLASSMSLFADSYAGVAASQSNVANSQADATDNQSGIIDVTYAYGDKHLAHVSLQLYLVGTVVSSGKFVPAQSFASAVDWSDTVDRSDAGDQPNSGTSSDSSTQLKSTEETPSNEPRDQQLAQTLADFATHKRLTPAQQTHADADGAASFTHLSSGLYLLMAGDYNDATLYCAEYSQLVWVDAEQSGSHVTVTPRVRCAATNTTSRNSAVATTSAQNRSLPRIFTGRNTLPFAIAGVTLALAVLLILFACDCRRRNNRDNRNNDSAGGHER